MIAPANSKDTVVDTLAKMLARESAINWHMYRDYARNLLKPAAALKDGELAAVLAAPDREITHAELRAGEAAGLAELGLMRVDP